MSDYIDRNRLKQVILTALQSWNTSLMELVMLKIDQIPAADVEPVRRWIPCSERLPGSCSVNGETVSCLAYIPSFGAVDIADYHPDVDEWTFMCLPVTVPHWQPLPEPPEEGDAGNGLD